MVKPTKPDRVDRATNWSTVKHGTVTQNQRAVLKALGSLVGPNDVEPPHQIGDLWVGPNGELERTVRVEHYPSGVIIGFGPKGCVQPWELVKEGWRRVGKPKYVEALEYFAQKRGITPEQLQKEIEESRSKYPGPDCLEPHEVEFLSEGNTLRSERMLHLHSCDECQAVIATAGGYCPHTQTIGLSPRAGSNPSYAQWCTDCGAIYLYDNDEKMTLSTGEQVRLQGWFRPGDARFKR